MSAPDIRYADRTLMVGVTGCGKSTLARGLFLAAAAPRMVIDPADSAATNVPGSVTVYGPGEDVAPQLVERAVVASLEARRDAPTLRYVPRVPDRLAEYSGAYRWAFARFPRYVWLDEAGVAMPATGGPSAARTYQVQGRKRELGHLACHTRPREIDRNLIAQAQHVVCWSLPNPDDRKVIADVIGVPVAKLTELLAGLERAPGTTATGYAWFQQRTAELTVFPPLKVKR